MGAAGWGETGSAVSSRCVHGGAFDDGVMHPARQFEAEEGGVLALALEGAAADQLVRVGVEDADVGAGPHREGGRPLAMPAIRAASEVIRASASISGSLCSAAHLR